jgi:hypothetical protein
MEYSDVIMVIRKLPGQNKWRLVSEKSGRNLGTYPTKAQAIARERQVNFFKMRAARWKK